MQRCLKCLIENAEQRRFCRRCGATLLTPCRRCGFANATDDLFCGGCGGKIASAPAPASNARAAESPEPAKGGSGGELFSGEQIAEMAQAQKTKSQQEPEKSAFDQDDIDKIFGGTG